MNIAAVQNINRDFLAKKAFVFSLAVSSFFLSFPLFYFPIIKITKLARFEQANIIEMIIRLYQTMPMVAVITVFSVVSTPILMVLCLMSFSLFEDSTNQNSIIYKIYFFSKQWMLLDIFTVAVFASMIKLGELVDVEIGLGTLFAFVIWLMIFWADKFLWFKDNTDTKPKSNLKAISYSIAALFLLVPANLLPIMTTTKLGVVDKTNLLESIMQLFEGEAWPIGIIVFLASFCGPWLKIFSIFYLTLTKTDKKNRNFKRNLYHYFEVAGRWSMIDIYIAVILVTIVKLNALANVALEAGSLIFPIMVIFILLSSSNVDLKETGLNESV